MSTLVRALFCAMALPAANPALAQTTPELSSESHIEAPAIEVTNETLSITKGFARATRPGAPVAGGFMTIANTGGTDDSLLGASSAVAGVMQIHRTAMDAGVMKMRELPDGLPIPAGATVSLKPGGYHIMFMDLKEPLMQGQTVEVTLRFARAGEVMVPLTVLASDAQGFPDSDLK